MHRTFLNTAIGPLLLFALLILVPAGVAAETVGVLITNDMQHHEKIYDVFLQEFRKSGFSGKVKFLVQRPFADPIAYSNAARKLIAADVDIILTFGASPTVAVIRERPKLPVIYADIYEPIVETIKYKWTTGVCSKYMISSLIRYLKASTKLDTLGVLYYGNDDDSKHQYEELKDLSSKYGFNTSGLDIRNRAELPGKLNNLNADAIFVTSSPFLSPTLPTVVRISLNQKIPTVSLIPTEDPSAMIMLSSDASQQGKMLASLTVDILGGKAVKDVPPVCSRKIELVYNVMDAKRLGLRLSMDLVTDATKLINK